MNKPVSPMPSAQALLETPRPAPRWNVVSVISPAIGVIAAMALLNPPHHQNFHFLGQPIGLFTMAFATGAAAGLCAACVSLKRSERLKPLGLLGLFMNSAFLVIAALALVPIRAPW